MGKVGEKTIGYCMKCKKKVEITIDEVKPTKYAHMNKGKCPKCGTTVCVMSK